MISIFALGFLRNPKHKDCIEISSESRNALFHVTAFDWINNMHEFQILTKEKYQYDESLVCFNGLTFNLTFVTICHQIYKEVILTSLFLDANVEESDVCNQPFKPSKPRSVQSQ